MPGDVATAEAVVDAVLDLVNMLNSSPGAEQVDYRVDKGGRELLQLGHPTTVRDDPGRPIRDYGRPARHVSWWQQLGSVSKHHEIQKESKVALMINSCS